MTTTRLLGAIGAICLACAQSAQAEPAVPGDAAGAAKAETSETCFNRGLQTKGSLVDWDAAVTGDGAAPPRRTVIEVRGEKKFNGVKAIETHAKFYDDAGHFAAENFGYTRLKSKSFINYGLKSTTVRQTLTPPLKQPISMNFGQSTHSRYTVENAYPGGRKETTDESHSRTFDGFKKLNFEVGKFKACKFVSVIVSKSAGLTYVIDKVDWIAAEGKYRGFTLLTEIHGEYSNGLVINQQVRVTKIRKFKMK